MTDTAQGPIRYTSVTEMRAELQKALGHVMPPQSVNEQPHAIADPITLEQKQ